MPNTSSSIRLLGADVVDVREQIEPLASERLAADCWASWRAPLPNMVGDDDEVAARDRGSGPGRSASRCRRAWRRRTSDTGSRWSARRRAGHRSCRRAGPWAASTPRWSCEVARARKFRAADIERCLGGPLVGIGRGPKHADHFEVGRRIARRNVGETLLADWSCACGQARRTGSTDTGDARRGTACSTSESEPANWPAWCACWSGRWRPGCSRCARRSDSARNSGCASSAGRNQYHKRQRRVRGDGDTPATPGTAPSCARADQATIALRLRRE